ncbi:hypothetical protein [Paracoccus aerodenitrificans]|uniref:hypothetical protein n=1 Tax=Paracoccus aerodenitrificans TaxID=3017781 RepID=UPI0022F0DB67|nr:hypothetical protein [Paracoccus aerodenitrificans]WBU64446.1 hypothetical protein PAE61_03095 [Paracoccus aerodenitrificans]
MLTISPAEEAIWHFIGVFQFSEERGRMRIEYDELSALKTEPEEVEIEPLDIANTFPYKLTNYIPNISYQPPPDAPVEVDTSYELSPQPEPQASQWWSYSDDLPELSVRPISGQVTISSPSPFSTNVPSIDVTEAIPQFELPVPGSVAVIVTQRNWSHDDDELDADKFQSGVVDLAVIDARMAELMELSAKTAVSVDVELPATEAAFIEMARSFEGMAAPEKLDVRVETSTRTKQDAEGLYQDGEEVESAPDIDALMPKYRASKKKAAEKQKKEDAPEENVTTGSTGNGPANISDPEENAAKSATPATVTKPEEAGHEVVHGNNTLINDASITSAWIQAPVVTAAGSVYNYTLISQTNIISDNDLVTGPDGTKETRTDQNDTEALNYAAYLTISNPRPIPEADDGGPQFWVTATLEGSLVSLNWVDQYNLITDNDITSITLHAQETMLVFGQNGATNSVSLTELGYQYDVIIANGNIINVNAIMQDNVLLDDDRVVTTESNGSISTSDNVLINQAVVIEVGAENFRDASPDSGTKMGSTPDGQFRLPQSVLDDPALKGLEVVRVLNIEKDLVSVNVIRQTNVLGDADQVELYRDKLAAGEGTSETITGSNVLINNATVQEFGVDSNIYVGGEIYTDALLYQAELVSSDAPLMPESSTTLASEAVLFLAEGMIGEDLDDNEFRPIGADQAISSDVMDTVVT